MEAVLILTLVYFLLLGSIIHRKNKEIKYYKEVIRVQNESILEEALKGDKERSE